MILIITLLFIGIKNFGDIFFRHDLETTLEVFFTIFIFADILTVLIAMRYSQLFLSLFRNSGFALAIVLIRISITAPPFYREALALFAAVFSYSVAWIYNKSIINIAAHLKIQKKEMKKAVR
ncbi:MAG: hypothetical protein OEV66_10290 [Spirochaetia bacterium]|nr:hypothetical protein [Spirochaetia bacterium]